MKALYEEFVEKLEEWMGLDPVEAAKMMGVEEVYDNDSEDRYIYSEGLSDEFEAYLKKVNIEIKYESDESDLYSREVVLKITKNEEHTYVCFYGHYNSYSSTHPYDSYKEVKPQEKTITEWLDV